MLILTTCVFVACSSPLGDSRGGGTGDSGGGSTYKGRPLDSYVRLVQNEAGYKQVVEPILQSLYKTDHNIYLLMKSRIESKPWYFVPGPLVSIPSHLVGAAVPLDQAALQSFSSVWVDDDLYRNMPTANDQGILILHEILMGIKLLKYDSQLNQCLSYSPKFEYCSEASKTQSGKPSDLTLEDYDHIRAAANEITQQYTKLTKEEWQDLFFRYEFDFSRIPLTIKGS
jgi:hypothetical protein